MSNYHNQTNRIFLLMMMALLFCLLGTARAQVLYGTVIGSVTDTTGSSVPGARLSTCSR